MKINGWTILADPMFLDAFQELRDRVRALKDRDPKGFHKKNAAKLLAVIDRVIRERIAVDPMSSDFTLGSTLLKNDNDIKGGQSTAAVKAHFKHWRRAKFAQQYRLFFRVHQEKKIIILAWTNNEGTKRAYGSKNDAYRVFTKMLRSGRPPSTWKELEVNASEFKASKL